MAERVVLSQKRTNSINCMRKRGFRPNQWQCNIAKAKRNAGEEYESRRGYTVPAKNFIAQGKICWAGCHHPGCQLPDATTAAINAEFWKIGEYNLQRTHLLGLIDLGQGNQLRKITYHVAANGKNMEVCQRTFMHIYGVTKNMIQTIVAKKEEGLLAIEDRRGHHNFHPTLDNQVIVAINNHIHRFPQYDIHYSRRTEGEKYLSPDLNLSIMFREFKNNNPDINNVASKSWIYRKIFRESGLRIGEPKTDTCKDCDEIFASMKFSHTQLEKTQAEEKLRHHQTRADYAYALLYEDIAKSKVDPSYIVLCCDLQQVLFSPTLTHGEMFYLRQFSTYNLCIYNGGTDLATMNVWHECEGKRGVDEVASALLAYVREKFVPLQLNESRTFIIWSDRCRGQNNNFQMICTLLLLVKERYFTKVTQKFLTTGHSFLPCDRLFALIERRKQVSKAFVPENWIEIIRSAQPSNPFEVWNLTQHKIMQIKGYLDILFPRPNTLKVTEAVVCEISHENPTFIRTKASHDELNWTEHIIHHPNQPGVRNANKVPLDLAATNIHLERKYVENIPLNESKKKDLRGMMKFLAPEHQQFYQQYL